MKINFVVTISLIFGILSSCNSKAENKSLSKNENLIIDTHTLSNYQDLPIKNTHLELSVNFQEKKIKGSVTHQFDKNRKVNLLILDTKYLKIDSIQDGNGNSLEYSIGESDELLGSALTVILNSESNEVVVFYETTDKSEALDWLLPNQTAGKTFPFMYTQGQSIFTRSWIPIQDTPGIRITYTAKINTPKNMMAVMSAANPQKMDTNNVYSFEMKQPIPPYLIALAVGNLEFKAIDFRTGVYAEPSMVDECANELVDMGKMVDVAEQLYGKYDWDRYDVIVLPPSFPFGGMENPRLTFALL